MAIFSTLEAAAALEATLSPLLNELNEDSGTGTRACASPYFLLSAHHTVPISSGQNFNYYI